METRSGRSLRPALTWLAASLLIPRMVSADAEESEEEGEEVIDETTMHKRQATTVMAIGSGLVAISLLFEYGREVRARRRSSHLVMIMR